MTNLHEGIADVSYHGVRAEEFILEVWHYLGKTKDYGLCLSKDRVGRVTLFSLLHPFHLKTLKHYYSD